MTNTKIVIAILAIAALALTVVGVAVAQNQFYTNAAPNTQTSNNGFWGWIGSCFGLRDAQGSEGQYVAPPTGVDAPAPIQGGYGYNYGYGPCWAGW